MKQYIKMDKMDDIQIMPGSTFDEIVQNIGLILAMPQESGPMCRDMGLSTEYLGLPDINGRAILTRDVFVAVQDQEPRAELKTVDFEGSTIEGTNTAIVEVEIKNG